MRRFALLIGGLALLAGIAATVSGATTQAETHWVVSDLGTLGGMTSRAVAINERGQVVGYSAIATKDEKGNPIQHAFMWQNGSMTDLGALPGKKWSKAVAINDRGQVIGQSGERAFFWGNGKMTDLGALPGAKHCRAFAINDPGQVVGRSGRNWGHAFLWQHGQMTDLGTLPGGHKSKALAINKRGQIIGWSGTALRKTHAFLWERGTMRDLGTLPGTPTSTADAINDRGQVAGRSGRGVLLVHDVYGTRWGHAVLWQEGAVIELAADARSLIPDINERGQVLVAESLWQQGKMTFLDFWGDAINDRGQIIGFDGGDDPVYWQGGRIVHLPTPPYMEFAEAVALNDRGQVVGTSFWVPGHRLGEFQMHAVLWTLKRG